MNNVMMDGPAERMAIGQQGGRRIYAEDEWDQPGERRVYFDRPGKMVATEDSRQVVGAFGDLVSTVKALNDVIEEFDVPLAQDIDDLGRAINLGKRRLLAMLERIGV